LNNTLLSGGNKIKQLSTDSIYDTKQISCAFILFPRDSLLSALIYLTLSAASFIQEQNSQLTFTSPSLPLRITAISPTPTQIIALLLTYIICRSNESLINNCFDCNRSGRMREAIKSTEAFLHSF
jgi:hypothetical protein